MRRSTRRSSMAVSVDFSQDTERITRNTRRSSSIVPSLEDKRNAVGNFPTRFSMSSFTKKVEELTSDQRDAIERVGFGSLLRIHHHSLRKNLLVELMERWDCEKRAFLILDRELTITPKDVALILGLRVTGNPVTLDEHEPYSDLEEEYGAASGSRKISVSALEQRLESLGDLANEDFIRTFLLFTFATFLFHNSNAKIDSRYLSLLRDLDKVSNFAWGLAVMDDLFSWLSRRKEQAKGMEGCLLLLQIWSYEHIVIGRPNLVDCSLGFPRACRWDGGRCHSQRHWFNTKFNELEENQVTWELQLTGTECEIDIIRDLLEAETEGKEVLSPQPSISSLPAVHESTITTTTTITNTAAQLTRRPPKSSRQLAILDEKPKREVGRSRHDVQDDISENSRLSTDASEITVEISECSSSFDMQEVQKEHIADTSLIDKEEYRVLKREYSIFKNEMNELRRENAMLRNHLSSNPRLEEEIAKLRKEVEDLKEENQRLRSNPNVLDRVESLILEYFDEFDDALHGK